MNELSKIKLPKPAASECKTITIGNERFNINPQDAVSTVRVDKSVKVLEKALKDGVFFGLEKDV